MFWLVGKLKAALSQMLTPKIPAIKALDLRPKGPMSPEDATRYFGDGQLALF